MLSVTYEPFMLSVIMKNVVMLGSGAQARGLTLQMFISVKNASQGQTVKLIFAICISDV
jgi:hypothetical protein